jgi:branched-chain amino acid transport system permease protein
MSVRADPLAAAALGIDVPRYKVAAFCISAALGSVSGSLYAFYLHFLSPDMVGTPVSLQMLAMLVVGGEGTLFGPLFGVAVLTLLPTVFQPLAQFKTLGSGLLLILFSLYLPRGIFGFLIAFLAGPTRPARPIEALSTP